MSTRPAAAHKVEAIDGHFIVTSGRSGSMYRVTPLGGDRADCTCEAGRHGRACSHVAAVRAHAADVLAGPVQQGPAPLSRAELDAIRQQISVCSCAVPVECAACREREAVLASAGYFDEVPAEEPGALVGHEESRS